MSTAPDVLPLAGVPRDYAWGSSTAIQSMLGIPADGTPMAELWFGAHPDAASPVDGSTLDAVIASDPVRLLGEGRRELPFLLKVLAAARPLSIQVHPNREQAIAGFDREDALGIPRTAADRNYRDRNHKPELLCALTDFEALCGFRPADDIAALLDTAGLPDLRERLAAKGLRAAFAALLATPEPASLVESVLAARPRLQERRPDAARTVELAAREFPGDVGIVLTLFLNHVRLRPGQAIYLGAGNVHAYLGGTGIEVMASSDNVLRCGLTPKHVDVAEVQAVADFTPLAHPVLEPVCEGDGVWRYDVPVPDFALRRVELDGAARLPGDGPRIVLCTAGSAAVDGLGLIPGRAAFVSASRAAAEVAGTGRLFVASV